MMFDIEMICRIPTWAEVIELQDVPTLVEAHLTDREIVELLTNDWVRDETERLVEEKDWTLERSLNVVCSQIVYHHSLREFLADQWAA